MSMCIGQLKYNERTNKFTVPSVLCGGSFNCAHSLNWLGRKVARSLNAYVPSSTHFGCGLIAHLMRFVINQIQVLTRLLRHYKLVDCQASNRNWIRARNDSATTARRCGASTVGWFLPSSSSMRSATHRVQLLYNYTLILHIQTAIRTAA